MHMNAHDGGGDVEKGESKKQKAKSKKQKGKRKKEKATALRPPPSYLLSYTNLTMALLLSVELRKSWYFLLPAVTMSMAVLGGMLPRFSATISISWKVWFMSITRKTVTGLVESRWCVITTCLLTSTVMESPSTSALS